MSAELAPPPPAAPAQKRSGGQKRDIQWADGLRGIACLLVVIAHTWEAFYWPDNAFDRPYYIFTVPFGRLVLQGGYLAVGIFFVMSGYVVSVKPLKLAREGRAEDARKVIASSAFRRVVRLGVPGIFATTVSWFLDRIGAFNIAKSMPGNCWLNMFSPPEFTFSESVRALFRACLRTWAYDGETWTTLRNEFEGIQWTMAYEVRGSMMVFLILIVTASFTPRHRAATFFFLIAYSMYADADVLLNIPFFVGALLADLSIVYDNSPILPIWNVECFGRRVAGVRVHWPILVFVLGLFFGSYPPNSYEQRSWSTMLHGFKEAVLPEAWGFQWTFSFLGAACVIFSMHFSPFLRKIFSYPFVVFLGSISFPMYLIHSMLMRSVLTWVVYGFIPESGGLARRLSEWDENPPAKSAFWTMITAVTYGAWGLLLVYLSVLWRDKLDGHFVKISSVAEDVMLGKRSAIVALSGLPTPVRVYSEKANGHH